MKFMIRYCKFLFLTRPMSRMVQVKGGKWLTHTTEIDFAGTRYHYGEISNFARYISWYHEDIFNCILQSYCELRLCAVFANMIVHEPVGIEIWDIEMMNIKVHNYAYRTCADELMAATIGHCQLYSFIIVSRWCTIIRRISWTISCQDWKISRLDVFRLICNI